MRANDRSRKGIDLLRSDDKVCLGSMHKTLSTQNMAGDDNTNTVSSTPYLRIYVLAVTVSPKEWSMVHGEFWVEVGPGQKIQDRSSRSVLAWYFFCSRPYGNNSTYNTISTIHLQW